MKNVIVTGGTGFIGRSLVERLNREVEPGGRVVALGSGNIDLTDNGATFAFFEALAKETPFDHVFHLAALYKAGDWPVHHPATQFYANMSLNVNVFEAWRRHLPKAKLTSVLSYCMYPSTDIPHPESELFGSEPEDYLFAYAATKKAVLIAQRAYRQEYGLSCAAVILPTVYGPGDSFAEDSHVLGALIGKFVRGVRDGQATVEVWGDGTQEREFLFVEDAADGIVTAARRSTIDVVNLGTGEASTVRAIVEMIVDAAGYQGETTHNTSKFVGVKKRMLDISVAKTQLEWSARTPLREGIRKTVEWYRSRLDGTPSETDCRRDG